MSQAFSLTTEFVIRRNFGEVNLDDRAADSYCHALTPLLCAVRCESNPLFGNLFYATALSWKHWVPRGLQLSTAGVAPQGRPCGSRTATALRIFGVTPKRAKRAQVVRCLIFTSSMGVSTSKRSRAGSEGDALAGEFSGCAWCIICASNCSGKGSSDSVWSDQFELPWVSIAATFPYK